MSLVSGEVRPALGTSITHRGVARAVGDGRRLSDSPVHKERGGGQAGGEGRGGQGHRRVLAAGNFSFIFHT